MALIEVAGLKKTFEYTKKEEGMKASFHGLFHREKLYKEAVKGIDFSLEKGEMVGFLGPNGAGKTTTLKMLSGILFPTDGHATVMGYVPWERKKDFKMRFAIVMGQKSQLWWDLPAVESFALNRHIYEIDEARYRKTLGELTEILDVKDLLAVQVRRLSLGERMKMELIASLLHQPEVIFLDEPTIGLDFISQKRIRAFLKEYNREKQATVLLTSHSIGDIEDLCRRTIVIADGTLAYDGELKKINALFGERKRIQVTFENEEAAGLDLSRFGTVCGREGLQATLEVPLAEVREVSRRILETLPVTDFNVVDIPVEEGIARLYTGGNGA
jgi:ABC-2 type transport system ATP-binding protein